MPTLPRNIIARRAKLQKKYGTTREVNKKIIELDSICNKHNVGNLSLTFCKYSDEEGNVTFIEQEHVRGNMRFGILIVKAKSMNAAKDLIYDVVQVARAKTERDEKKKEGEDEKTKEELERLQNDNPDPLPEGNAKHHDMVNELTSQAAKSKEILQQMEEPLEKETEKETKMTMEKNKFIKQMNNQSAQKAQKTDGNRFYRSFMKDLRSKFSLIPIEGVKYFEVKMESTAMLIENATVYKLVMPASTPDIYILVVGDLQMKSQVLRRIDPAYGADRVFQEHSDFLERIKAQENTKITEYKEDLLEKEFSDLDALGLPSEDEKSEETRDQEKID